jgi:hypothetical protein
MTRQLSEVGLEDEETSQSRPLWDLQIAPVVGGVQSMEDKARILRSLRAGKPPLEIPSRSGPHRLFAQLHRQTHGMRSGEFEVVGRGEIANQAQETNAQLKSRVGRERKHSAAALVSAASSPTIHQILRTRTHNSTPRIHC